MEVINYNISKNYLSHWGINEALREIMQNFMDYGEYKVKYDRDDITIFNSFVPKDLSFLAVGESQKESKEARGKYGEGLKMAMLVFAREEIDIVVQTQEERILPTFIEGRLGETFALEIDYNPIKEKKFSVSFRLPLDIWENYYNDIIKKEDIIFEDNYYGRIVDREAGRIYCSGLFVTKVDNMSRSYDINHNHLPLTRDRSLPKTFDVNWASAKILESQGKLQVRDLTYSDTEYVSIIPEEIKKTFKPKIVGNSVEFVATVKKENSNETEEILLKNKNVRSSLLTDNIFTDAIKKLKIFLLSKLGVYDALVEFRDKYVYEQEAKEEFNLIIERLK